MDKLFDYIKRLQKRPSEERERIAFSTAVAIAGVIFIFWITSFFRGLSTAIPNNGNGVGVAKNPTVEDVSPFNSIGETFSSFWSDLMSFKKSVPSISDIEKAKNEMNAVGIASTTPDLATSTEPDLNTMLSTTTGEISTTTLKKPKTR